ncbi:hypothetical protein IT40_13640 [Paracoccus versutus]|nr:hypothetical protein IT40_13640 [Paracoccus versutus]
MMRMAQDPHRESTRKTLEICAAEFTTSAVGDAPRLPPSIANRIMVGEGGRIVEQGSHDEQLAREEGRYRRLAAAVAIRQRSCDSDVLVSVPNGFYCEPEG